MRGRKRISGALVIAGVIVLCMIGGSLGQETDYYTAAHYFANEWPVNFWNAEWDTLDRDLQQIRQDGFNTVIIVVPWREFQPGTDPVVYSEYAFDKLDYFLGKAQEYGLKVQMRLGYMYDYCGEADPAERYYNILGDGKLRDAWFDYAAKIYQTSIRFSCFDGGFLTWEDFWHNYALTDYIGGTEDALAVSVKDGFPEYLGEKYSLETFNRIYASDFQGFHEIGVPERTESWAEEWFCFIDDFMIELLDSTREYFPGLFMEVRTDDDLAGTRNGKKERISHERTWACGDCAFMAMMYKPSQGALWPASGSQVPAETAWMNMERHLAYIYQHNGGKPIYIDQFLYVDNTPGYHGGRFVKDEEISDYLIGCEQILKKYTNGYGIWVYRDYCNNILFNPQFALGTEGWDSLGQVEQAEWNGSRALRLSEGAEISQEIPVWHRMDNEGFYFSMDYASAEKGTVRIRLGMQEENIEIEGNGTLQLHFQDEDELSLQIYAETDMNIDNVKLYSFIQSQDMYDIDNRELSAAAAVRTLNIKLLENRKK